MARIAIVSSTRRFEQTQPLGNIQIFLNLDNYIGDNWSKKNDNIDTEFDKTFTVA